MSLNVIQYTQIKALNVTQYLRERKTENYMI